MRNKTSSSMQKTYDECYLICSTAVYFEGQNNEAEALRSWRSALDQIYYHNAYRVPPNYQPKSETEKALQDSLRDMEMQCKERVDLLEALRQSRAETKSEDDKSSSGTSSVRGRSSLHNISRENLPNGQSGWLGHGTVPAVNYPDLSKPAPPLPKRPAIISKKSMEPPQSQRSPSVTEPNFSGSPAPPPYSPPALSLPAKHTSRTPSPEKRSNRMLTTLRPNKDGKRPSKSPRGLAGRRSGPPAASKAAGLAWDSKSRSASDRLGQSLSGHGGSTTTLNSVHRESFSDGSASRQELIALPESDVRSGRDSSIRRKSPPDSMSAQDHTGPTSSFQEESRPLLETDTDKTSNLLDMPNEDLINLGPPSPALAKSSMKVIGQLPVRNKSPSRPSKLLRDYPSYRHEYPAPAPVSASQAQALAARSSTAAVNPSAAPSLSRQRSPVRKTRPPAPPVISRRPLANSSSPRLDRQNRDEPGLTGSAESADENTSSSRENENRPRRNPCKKRAEPTPAVELPTTPTSTDRDSPEEDAASRAWSERVKYIKKHLPKGVDANAAEQIFNEIVVRGDEVHWDDVAGLDVAKKALKEAVVYPFLRPDLFMGLREPARGMLLFGPPGTGKTMLARAVATESRSTFFAISASSLTSKWLGESEKLVRALFALARALAPSIIFVDEIDSLLSSRGGSSEHESTRRIKTEFLIQWSDLQRAAAGKEQTDKEKKIGDASRVLVLAATNTPWAIDEAARRRFVRRQYIPLPEAEVRGTQLRTLLGHQKHDLNEEDIQVMIELTDGFSGSDITALAKDAAMGPLRSLGEALLHMSMDEIRPIQFEDFEASLINIRPSVGKQGLKEYEDWAREFGERGG